MSVKSFYWKARTLLSGDYREIERNMIAAKNARVIRRYQGQQTIYCVLRMYSDEAGLFNYFLKGLAGVSYAVQHGFIPVVDMQTKENIFFDKKERKQKNLWEIFFRQPAGISFSELKGKKNVIVIENLRLHDGLISMQQQPVQTAYWRAVCKKYIRFSSGMQKEIDAHAKDFAARKKWLGVLARGTDFLSMGVGHAVQPDSATLLRKVDEVRETYGCDGIFLATEDADILGLFLERYKDELLYFEQKRYRGKQDTKLGQLADYRDDAISMNMTYLAAVYYLSRCSCFICSNTGGAQGAYLLSDGFTYMHAWYLGTMGSTDPQTLDITKL